jgi:hypothetical protein
LRVGGGIELFVEGEADGLDGDVWAVGFLEEGPSLILVCVVTPTLRGYVCIPQDARGDVASTANSDHEVGLELIENLLCRLLAVLVDLCEGSMSVLFPSCNYGFRFVLRCRWSTSHRWRSSPIASVLYAVEA